MVGLNRNIVRAILLVSYVLLVALIISGISALIGYLNTGADRSKMLHTEVRKVVQYLPKVVWKPLKNEGRPMDMENLNGFQKDYLDAWYVRHMAYKTNLKVGIKDYYTDNARVQLYDFIAQNKAQNITIESTTLKHSPSLEFFSEDGQLIVITDKNVVEYKRVLKAEKLVLETTEMSTYKIAFLLEDGFWRIRHLVKEVSEDFRCDVKTVTTNALSIKGINYYPQATPWDMFGDAFSKDIVSKDFKIIKDAGLNSIRVFVPYDLFSKADVDAPSFERLQQTLDIAAKHDLKVVLTLFDFYGDYSVLDWTLNQRYIEKVVSKFKDHSALLAWDIKNEPNLDFESRGKDLVIAWLTKMLEYVKMLDTMHSVTIGWSDTKSATILKDMVDFVSFHYYEDLEALDSEIKRLKKEVPNKPLVLQEFGLSSYTGFWNPFGFSDQDQANYHKKVQGIIARNDLPYMSWTLYDFVNVPTKVVGMLPWRKNAQKRFGFIDENGIKKAAFTHISK